MFIYILTKNDIGLMHRDVTRICGHWYKHMPPQTLSYRSTYHASNVKVKDTYLHRTTFGRGSDN